VSNILGENIKKEREKLRLSVTDIHVATGISKSNIYALERGERIGKSLIKYLFYLRSKNVNLNNLFKNI